MKKGGESISAEGTQGKVSSKKTSSKEISKIPLEETIHKVLLSELKLIFPEHFFHESNAIMSKQIVAPIEPKIKS